MSLKPRIIVGRYGKFYCGIGVRQVETVRGFDADGGCFPYGKGDTPLAAWHKWKRATVPYYGTRIEQHSAEARNR